ncbi:MAG: hypothetical protein M3R24_23205, partial [Chloroflexota bacterium]|nr:hypothetical protein [Chloroflexota bacterium]
AKLTLEGGQVELADSAPHYHRLVNELVIQQCIVLIGAQHQQISKGVTKTKNVDHALPAATIKRANTQSSRST